MKVTYPLLVIAAQIPANLAFILSPSSQRLAPTLAVSATANLDKVGNRISIDESFTGLKKIYSSPDIFIIENFLDESSCEDLINKAQDKDLSQSPVAYAGKTDDKNELLGLAAKGPVAWLALGLSWLQVQQNADSGSSSMMQLGINFFLDYAVFFAIAYASITAFIEFRADELQTLRTSTSTTLDNLDDPSSGTGEGGQDIFILNFSFLFD